MNVTIADMKALKQLGMRCLVMDKNGTALAYSGKLAIDEDLDRWINDDWTGHGFYPQKLNNYCDEWKESLIDLNNECAA